MLKYPLYDFIATVPTCLETATLADVLDVFEKEQCQAIAVLDKQQYLLGLLYSARLVPQLLLAGYVGEGEKSSYLQQPISMLARELIQPLQTIPASFQVEQLVRFLRSQTIPANTNLDWALIDSDGKFLGLVDNSRLLKWLVLHQFETPEENGYRDASVEKARTFYQKQRRYQPQIDKPLVQLLERLPWPLMLQTSSGEVVTQNPAWWQQLGALKDPEGVRRQVEAILAMTPSKYSTQTAAKAHSFDNSIQEMEEKLSSVVTQSLHTSEGAHRKKFASPPTTLPEQPLPETSASRCFLNRQLGTCTCVVEVQNGQERVWQFAKIPLDSPEFKVLGVESTISLNTQSLELGNELWLVLATDVTEQQQLCKELAAKNADLIQLNRLKDEFLACISHELKTPLTAVLGLSRLLVDRQLGELNERQARYAGLIHQSGRHLMSVVNDILDLTRMETGQMELALSKVTIRAVCDRAVSEAKVIHAQSTKTPINTQSQTTSVREHQFSLSIEPGLNEMVADELRLRQMLVHLLSNAFKFTETGGEIGLWVSRWEGWIAFTVWDTGIGIPEHQQHLIFQKFQQLENPLTRQYEGTGLGLVLTRALARLHGGDVSFLSREGKGSQFTLLLPPSPPQKGLGAGERELGTVKQKGLETENWEHDTISPIPPVRTTKETPAVGRMRHPQSRIANSQAHYNNSLVLVVEAVARYIEDLTEQLTGLGYRVVIARSGCEAVEKARRLQPKAIFLNPLVPLLSGWDVLTLLKSDEVSRHIPVVVTATGAEKEQAFANRADGFLSLPVQPQVLAPLIESLCVAPEEKKQKPDEVQILKDKTPLQILRLVNPECQPLNSHPLLQEHRVLEVDNIDQAELLSRVWQFDVILMDVDMPEAENLLQQLNLHPQLAALPLVTCNVATTQTASQIAGLSVFPCLTPLGTEKQNGGRKTDALLSVLQIASGVCCPPNILVLDLALLPDLPETRRQTRIRQVEKTTALSSMFGDNNSCPIQGLQPLTICRGSEWFQALIQYLQTAGFKASMSRSWAELLQQIRHQSVDLLLICLGESTRTKEAHTALKVLGQLPFDLPPVLVLDQRLNSMDLENEQSTIVKRRTYNQSESVETVLSSVSCQILPRSISMEELLKEINQTLNG
ncbi:hybrid sensor histidine kinase/response regulator [Scytonema hofmannii PCC 7110]|uniref:histidine kinase n=1 Tax=Scytonema hofmannii PCC 7110 TaxID=128403 RepID=A0A139XF21_9CYAN|nr:ATP-binding protein [Scytonema hofmannii]KYC43263.1 hybrid sensor histidine kinase/response regulator [Scytonema hofmannii PCC 7110]